MAEQTTERAADFRVSDYEARILRHLTKRRGLPLGDRQVAVAAAARRLEKKGLAVKGTSWYITRAGEEALAAKERP